MANSMIPYSFIPGTKAKAGEVNANFVALADTIEANKTAASGLPAVLPSRRLLRDVQRRREDCLARA